jgi:urease accessory protein
MFLLSPQRPTGAFSFSSALESFVAKGMVHDRDTLFAYLKDLVDLGYKKCELPLLKRCFMAALLKDNKALSRWNTLSYSLRETEEFFVEERDLGAAIMRLVKSLGLAPRFLNYKDFPEGPGFIAATSLFAVALGLSKDDTELLLQGFLWALIENQVTAAAKTIPLGQSDTQSVLLHLMKSLPETVREAALLKECDIGTSLPMRAILSASHEISPLRMFRS